MQRDKYKCFSISKCSHNKVWSQPHRTKSEKYEVYTNDKAVFKEQMSIRTKRSYR
jgi:hypothetical protein